MIAAATLSLTVGTTPQEATAQTGPTVSLSVAPNPVAEGQSVTVTATLARALTANVTVPLVLTAVTAEAGDFGLLASITISGGQTTGTGTITTVKDLDRDDERFSVALGTLPAAVSRGTPSLVDVNITDDRELLPLVTVTLTPSSGTLSSVPENGGVVTLTATLDKAAQGTVTVTFAVAPAPRSVHPENEAQAGDFTVSANKTLKFAAGAITSTGTVTISAVDNSADERPNKHIRVSGTVVGNAEIGAHRTSSSFWEFIIKDDDPQPFPTVVLTPAAISEDGGSSTVTVTVTNPTRRGDLVLDVELAPKPLVRFHPSQGPFENQADPAADVTLSANKRLVIAAGQTSSTGTVTITAVDNGDDTPTQHLPVRVKNRFHTNEPGVTDATVVPWDVSRIGPPGGDLRLHTGHAHSSHFHLLDLEDDDATTVTLAGAAGDLEEGEQKTITVTLGRGLVSGETLAVPLTFGTAAGSATRGTDYTLSGASATGVTYANLNSGNATVTFDGPDSGATATVATLTLTATSDSVDEPTPETVDIGLGTLNANSGTGLGGGASGTDDLAPFSIDDRAGPGIVIAPSPLYLKEGESAPYTVRLASEPTGKVTVHISGVLDTVLTHDKSRLTFTTTNWRQTQTVTVTGTHDEDGITDSATLDHTAEGGGYDSVSQQLGVIILDDDTPGIVIAPDSLGVDEGDEATYTVKLATKPSSTATVAIAGHAGTDLTLGTDSLTFTTSTWNTAQTVTVKADHDDDADNDAATLSHSASGGTYDGQTANLPVTVTDDETEPSGITLTASPDSVAEDDGATIITVTAEIDGAARFTEAKTVTVSVSDGTATAPADYVAVSNFDITIAAGAANGSGEFTLTPVDDAAAETTETIRVTGTAPDLTVTPDTISITDDESPPLPQVSFASASSSASENDGTQNVTVNLSPAPTAALTVGYTVGGTATAGTDYTALSGTVSVASGATSVAIPVVITDDMAAESSETVVLTLNAGNGYTVGSPSGHTLTITDNDGTGPPSPNVRLSAAPNPVDEGSSVTVTATLSGALSNAVTIPLVLTAGTAEPGDFGSLGSITISGGGLTGTGTVTTTDDADEDDETFTVALGTR